MWSPVQNGTTVTVTGHVGDDVVHDNVEQRIIEPALVDTVIGKRVCAPFPGDSRGSEGWLLVGAGVRRRVATLTATYIFDNESDTTIAANAGLGERGMALGVRRRGGQPSGLDDRRAMRAWWALNGWVPNGPLQPGPPGPPTWPP